MTDRDLPELPSDEELGIAGLDEEELLGGRDSGGTSRKDGRAGPGEGPPPAGPAEGRAVVGPGGGRRWMPALVTLVVLLLGVWLSSANRTLPSPAPANAADTAFSSARAMSLLVEMARAPRPVGSPEHTRVRELLLDRLREMGLEPEVQESLSMTRRGQMVRAVSLRNLVARIPGEASTGAILLTAHYDAVPVSRGAGDAGMGVAALMEAVRALLDGPPLENDVIVLLTDGEELGLLGARAFVEEHPWMDDVSVVLSVEMRGGGGPSIMFETGDRNGWVVQAMGAGDPRPLAHSLSVEVYRRLPNDTDFTPFRRAGIQGLNFAGIDRAWIYHQATDIPANVSEATLQHQGMRILGITRELGRRELTETHAPDRVHFTLPLLGLVTFPVAWMLPLAAGLLLLWVGAAVMVRLRAGTGLGMLLGFGAGVAAVGLSAGAGWALMRWLPPFHPEFGTMTPAFYGEGWYVVGLAALATVLTLGLYGLLRSRFSAAELATGALVLPVAGGVALAATMPLAALVVVGPAGAGVLAAGIAALLGGRRRKEGEGRREPAGTPWRLAALLLALPVLALIVPVFELLWLALSLRAAALLGAALTVMLLCMLPALDALVTPNRWWAPLAGLAVAGAAVGGGLLFAGPSEEHPLPSTLVYAIEREGVVAAAEEAEAEPEEAGVEPEEAAVAPEEEPAAAPARAWWISRPDPGVEWAEEQVGGLGEGEELSRFFIREGHLSGSAEPVDLALPEVRAMRVEGDERAIRLSVASGVGAEMVRLVFPPGGSAEPVGLNGRDFPPAPPGSPGGRRPVTRVEHIGVPHDGLTLELRAEAERDTVALSVVEEHLRAPELLGEERFRRPAGLMPSSGFPFKDEPSDRAVLRTELRVPVRSMEPSG